MTDTRDPFEHFADARGRPTVFFFLSHESISRRHVLELYDQLAGLAFDEIDLVIHSGGGDAHTAYQTVMLLRHHAARINACVPFWAKSAATLLCIGADKIILGEHAELGPLDVQIYEEKKAGQGEYNSALNPFKALEQLQSVSLEALALAMEWIVRDYGMSYDDSLRHAIAFVQATTGPLVGRLDPEKLGQYSRELSVATEYGRRLLGRCTDWSDQQIARVVDKLVYGYPSHEYVIDYPELQSLGFAVELFSPDERECVERLRPTVTSGSQTRMVRLVNPLDSGQTNDENAEDDDAPPGVTALPRLAEIGEAP